jgi:hypothetical protein
MNTEEEKKDDKNVPVNNKNDHISVDEEQTFWVLYDHLRITMEKNIPEPDPIISIDGNIISTPGNITMISGSSKAGKSAFCSVILAGSICGNEGLCDGFENLDVDSNKNNKAVVHVDTEQAKHNHFRNLKNAVLTRSSLSELPEHFYSYNIREMELRDRMKFTEDLCDEAAKEAGGIHLIVIDGLADYAKSVNDEVSANTLVHSFEKLSVKYACPVIAIVHLNPNSKKERGHLGSQLQRKAESVLQIKKDNNDLSYCEPVLLRNASTLDVPMIQFGYNTTKDYHTFMGIRNPEKPNNDNAKFLRKLTEEIFSDQPIQSKLAIERIIEVSGKSEATANRYLKLIKEDYNFIKSVQVPDQSGREVYYVSLLE